ncbi:hypothetical protein B0T21DRAFT_406886 [Apiosordaria backusii]|uniref:Uncharacterized protein n=1 Tax=Apiosordaria backusii TaxID=314023 RepID=A0AA40EZG9_9PEZI|nr:hypothetical protein B0T21DRAFT_406886 [Apiosordaria backusii]
MTSFLFTDAEVIFNTTEEAIQPKGFYGLDFNEKSDMRAILEVVSATEIYEGVRRGWVTSEYAFPPFAPVSELDSENMTVSTMGYSGVLDCRTIFSVPDIPLNKTSNRYDFNDCGPAARMSRISLLAGTSKSNSLTNVTLIFCIPSYWATPGNLTVTLASSTHEENITSVNNFDTTTETPPQPRHFESWQLFELALHTTTGFSPSDQVDGGLFGQFVYALAAKTKPGSELESETLSCALSVLFSSTFAVMAAGVLFQDAEIAGVAMGTRSTPRTRLIVVLPVSGALMGVLVIMSVMMVVLFWYIKKPSILREEPVGLRGYARIMEDGEINRLVKTAADIDGT